MQIHERELLIYRIACGYLKYKVGPHSLRLEYPSIEVRYKANEVYKKYFDRSRNKGLMEETDLTNFLLQTGYLTEKDEKELEILPKHIDQFKVQMFENYFKSDEVERIRKYLNVAKLELNKKLNKKHIFDYVTCEGIANFAKWQYIIKHSTFYRNDRWDWREGSPYEALNYYYSQLLGEDEIRNVANNSPWDNIWTASKKSGQVFSRTGADLTLDQQRLICWSNLYDNVHESADCPSRRVIEDNDMLDGWMIVQRKKREKDDTQQMVDGLITNPKIANAKELYIPVGSQEDAQAIYDLNSPQSKRVIQQRLNQIKQKGEVK